jgi:uncharacterized protein YcbK (DUF882 family)
LHAGELERPAAGIRAVRREFALEMVSIVDRDTIDALARTKQVVPHRFHPRRIATAFVVNERVSIVDLDQLVVAYFPKNILRDRRNGEAHDMDVRLYDQLFDLARAAQVEPHYEIISAYRSQESNDKMSSRPGSGVAKKSLHMQGRAIDVRLRNCPTSKLRDLALEAKRGGVGYYERSDFVHIDTGNFRTWTG